MFEHFNTPEEIFEFRLGSALKMERKLVDTLEELQESTQRPEIQKALAQHREQTLQHVRNVEECFRVLGQDPDDSPCAVVEAMEKEAKMLLGKADEELADVLVLSAALESEHHEIAVYESLIINAEARGANEVVALLRQNLADEHQALEIARTTLAEIARAGIAAGASRA